MSPWKHGFWYLDKKGSKGSGVWCRVVSGSCWNWSSTIQCNSFKMYCGCYNWKVYFVKCLLSLSYIISSAVKLWPSSTQKPLKISSLCHLVVVLVLTELCLWGLNQQHLICSLLKFSSAHKWARKAWYCTVGHLKSGCLFHGFALKQAGCEVVSAGYRLTTIR